MTYYAVIDTNVLVSSLLTKNGNSPVVKVVDAIRDSKVIPMFNEEIFAEYKEVLSRDRLGLDENIVSETLEMIKSRGINCERTHVSDILPDPDDVILQRFILLRCPHQQTA